MEASDYDLPGYCLELLTDVEEKTGYPLRLSSKPALEFDSEVRMARGQRQFHVVEFRQEYRHHEAHFAVSAAYKILRTWKVSEKERYVPASEVRRGLPQNDYQELRRKLPSQLKGKASEMSRYLFGSLTRQLTSFPVDIRVEREIAEALPQHHEAQGNYLSRQVQDFLPTLDEGMLLMFPEHVYRASTAMNIAFTDEAAELAGVPSPPPVRTHGSRQLAELLLAHLHDTEEPGILGDRQLTDSWAKELGLEGWYDWVRLDEIRP